jgi:hypothetical protein
MTTMGAISKRLHRLERRLGTAVESEATRHLRMRLENARRRCGSPAPSPERLAELRGMTVPQILHLGRQQRRSSSATVRDLVEHAPLLGPIRLADNRPQVSFVDAANRRQEEKTLLNVGREMQ